MSAYTHIYSGRDGATYGVNMLPDAPGLISGTRRFEVQTIITGEDKAYLSVGRTAADIPPKFTQKEK